MESLTAARTPTAHEVAWSAGLYEGEGARGLRARAFLRALYPLLSPRRQAQIRAGLGVWAAFYLSEYALGRTCALPPEAP